MDVVMPLTPEDVSNKRFTPVRLREGYDMGEVDQFLDEVEAELARLTRENDELRTKLAAAQGAAPSAPAPEPVQQAPAPTPVPAIMAVGVASPNAQGQAITRTATALMMAVSSSPVANHQPPSVAKASSNTTGTNIALTLSTSF